MTNTLYSIGPQFLGAVAARQMRHAFASNRSGTGEAVEVPHWQGRSS